MACRIMCFVVLTSQRNVLNRINIKKSINRYAHGKYWQKETTTGDWS
jgi:hypothetical protein